MDFKDVVDAYEDSFLIGNKWFTKQQILENQEKAEKWDSGFTCGDCYDNGRLEQENQKLKEENKHLTDINYERFFSIDELRKRNKKLKEIAERLKKRIKEFERFHNNYTKGLHPDELKTLAELKEILATKEES